MTRAKTQAETEAARWSRMSRAEFDAKRELVRQDMEQFCAEFGRLLRAQRLQREGRAHG